MAAHSGSRSPVRWSAVPWNTRWEYRYDPASFTVAWTTLETSNVVLTGEARFVALSNRACLMLYRLVLDLPVVDDRLRSEIDPHPASHVVAEFQEYLRQLC